MNTDCTKKSSLVLFDKKTNDDSKKDENKYEEKSLKLEHFPPLRITR